MNSEWAVETKALAMDYGNGEEVLTGVDLRVPRGSVYGLLGRTRLARALTTVDGALTRLEILARSDSAGIGLAAGRVLRQCRDVRDTR